MKIIYFPPFFSKKRVADAAFWFRIALFCSFANLFLYWLTKTLEWRIPLSFVGLAVIDHLNVNIVRAFDSFYLFLPVFLLTLVMMAIIYTVLFRLWIGLRQEKPVSLGAAAVLYLIDTIFTVVQGGGGWGQTLSILFHLLILFFLLRGVTDQVVRKILNYKNRYSPLH